MIPAERRSRIIEMLIGRPAVSIAEITRALRVSHMTVRRDLRALAETGQVVPVSGGARLADPTLAREAPHAAKAAVNRGAKAAIGAAAARIIPQGAAVYLDAGTTTLALADCLTGRDDLTVVTNDFVILERFATRTGAVLHHTGGRLDRENRSAIGEAAARAIGAFQFDIAFISSSSFGPRGLSVTDPGKGLVKEAAVAVAERSVLLVDGSKYGRRAPYASIPLAAFDLILTDATLPEDAYAELGAAGVSVTLVEGAAP